MTFVVLCSTKGTLFQAVIDRMHDGSLKATCAGLVTDRSDRGCTKKAQAAGLPVQIVEKISGESREDYDKRVDAAVRELLGAAVSDDYCIACMGWMWIFSPWFVSQHKNRIVNVHPSLLPKYPGAHAHELVLASGDKETGMTIHLIDEGVDTGKILEQKRCPVFPDDTIETLRARVQALECEWYPKLLAQLSAKVRQ